MKYLKVICALCIFFISTIVRSQPGVVWTSNIVGQGYDETFDVTLDTARNVFICGQIEYTSYFSGYPLSTAGIHDIYIAKYSSSGTLLWARREGGVGGDKAYSVGTDDAGNSYIVGEYEENFTFGNTHVVADAGNNLFVAKYDPSGQFQWVRTLQGGGETVRGYAIAVDHAGNVYAGGTIRGDAVYNSNTLYSTRGSADIVILKFTTNGNFVWAKRIGDVNDDEVYGLAVKDDKLYATGYFVTRTKFGNTTTVNSNGDGDFFLAQFDTSGQFLWARHGGSPDFDEGRDVTINSNGEIICTGNFRGTASFSGTQISSMGNTDIFVVSYDASGNVLWAKKYGGTGFDSGEGVVHDLSGNLYVTGNYEGVALFDSMHATSYGQIDIFLEKCDSAGTTQFVKSFGGPGSERGRSCAVDKFGNIFVNGEYWTYAYLDTFLLNGQLLIDAFLARVGDYPVCTATTQVTYPINCYNQCDGAAMVIPTGQDPFTYDWTTASSQHADSVSSLCPGSYSVTVTDAFGCVATSTVNLTQPSQITSSGTITTNPSCSSCSDGGIDITPTGGVPPYTFNWSNGSTSEDLTNVPNGSYQVCIGDANGCNDCLTFSLSFSSGIVGPDLSDMIKINMEKNLIDIDNETSESEFSITSTSGQLILKGEIFSGFNQIAIGTLSSGSYILSIKTHQGSLNKLLVKS